MKPLASSAHTAEVYAAAATTQMHARWTYFGSRSKPKIHSARKVDSAKNETTVSTARGAPKTLAAEDSRPVQLALSWNSMARPVAMPTA